MWLIIAAAVVVVIYWQFLKPLGYWKERGIPCKQPWPIVGNLGPTFLKKKPLFEAVKDFYKDFPDKRYNGIYFFTRPMLLIRDLELIKQITVKDFDHFADHLTVLDDNVDPLIRKNLFLLKGQRWRDMRATLSPSFTSSKMKMMFSLLSDCAEQFTRYFQKQEGDTITVELKDIFSRFTNDAIASVAFGLKVESLEEKDNEFYAMGRNIIALNSSGLRTLVFFVLSLSPALSRFIRMSFLPPSITNFLRRIVKETMQKRKQEGLVRPDMIHLLMEAQKDNPKPEEINVIDAGFATVEESHIGKIVKRQKTELTDDDIAAQALIFFFGGFETSSNLMCFMAYELATNPDILEKLQDEVDNTLNKCNGKITYEALLGMKYLDMVVSETLRKWPPLSQLDRMCVKDFVIKPEKAYEASFTIKQGMVIALSVAGLHYDPNYFPNPEKFDPERFSDENKQSIQAYSYLPFGSGPRSCIASRFALLEIKILFFHLLSKFDVVAVDKTPIPLRLGTKGLGMIPDDGFWLGMRPRKLHKN